MEKVLLNSIDREAVHARVARLANGEDQRSAELIRACWWPPSRFDYDIHSGYPFSAEHFHGRAKGDFSETWFAGAPS